MWVNIWQIYTKEDVAEVWTLLTCHLFWMSCSQMDDYRCFGGIQVNIIRLHYFISERIVLPVIITVRNLNITCALCHGYSVLQTWKVLLECISNKIAKNYCSIYKWSMESCYYLIQNSLSSGALFRNIRMNQNYNFAFSFLYGCSTSLC
jgi:hypothetical protein